MNQNEQSKSRSPSFARRAIAAARSSDERALAGHHPAASIQQEKEIAVTKGNTSSGFPPWMSCTSHNHYG